MFGIHSPRPSSPILVPPGQVGKTSVVRSVSNPVGTQGCSTHLVSLACHLKTTPDPEAQQVVELLRVPQALHELHTESRMRSLGDCLVNSSSW